MKKLLKSARILRPRNKGDLQLISSLRIIPSEFTDNDKQPLVADLRDEELYLASEYDREALATLRSLGLKYMSYDDCLDRLDEDIASQNSKVRDCTDQPWQSRLEIFLMRTLKSATKSVLARIMRMPLIPLADGTWTTRNHGAVNFPDTAGVPIPTCLGLRLVDPKRIPNAKRQELLTMLGVTTCSPDTIRKMILEQH